MIFVFQSVPFSSKRHTSLSPLASVVQGFFVPGICATRYPCGKGTWDICLASPFAMGKARRQFCRGACVFHGLCSHFGMGHTEYRRKAEEERECQPSYDHHGCMVAQSLFLRLPDGLCRICLRRHHSKSGRHQARDADQATRRHILYYRLRRRPICWRRFGLRDATISKAKRSRKARSSNTTRWRSASPALSGSKRDSSTC